MPSSTILMMSGPMAKKTLKTEDRKVAYQDSFGERGFGFEKTSWLKNLRTKSFERFKALGFPSRKDEAWRDVNLKPVLGSSFTQATPVSKSSVDLELLRKKGYDPNEHHLVFENGFLVPHLSKTAALPKGLTLTDIKSGLAQVPDILKTYLGREDKDEDDVFNLINLFSFEDGSFLHVSEGVKVTCPIHLWFIQSSHEAGPMVSNLRNLIVAQAESQIELVIHTLGVGEGSYLMNQAFEMFLLPQSSVNVVFVQEPAQKAYEFISTRVSIDKESRLEMTSFACQGFVRHDTRVQFVGRNSFCMLRGLAVLNEEAESHHHTCVHHAAYESMSRQLFKSILSGKAISEYSGLVHVHKEGQKSDSNQLNRNLLLSDDARAHSRPQLKIDADDVKCTHGSTVGQMMGDELFYLQSRGLDTQKARSLIVYGFAQEVLQTVHSEPLRRNLEGLVRNQLKNILVSPSHQDRSKRKIHDARTTA